VNCSPLKVPGLYNTEELESIISPLKDIAAQEGFVGSPASYFSKCKTINRSFVVMGQCFSDISVIRTHMASKNAVGSSE
jgi:hypothetical protein